MSNEDPTQELPDESAYITQPGVTAIISRINALDEKWDRRFQALETRLDRMDSRLDRIESMALEMRADLRDLKTELKAVLPALR